MRRVRRRTILGGQSTEEFKTFLLHGESINHIFSIRSDCLIIRERWVRSVKEECLSIISIPHPLFAPVVLQVQSHWTRKTSRDLTASALKYHPLARLIKPAPLKLCECQCKTTSAAQLNILTLRVQSMASVPLIYKVFITTLSQASFYRTLHLRQIVLSAFIPQ